MNLRLPFKHDLPIGKQFSFLNFSIYIFFSLVGNGNNNNADKA